jgi:hypothetical protein
MTQKMKILKANLCTCVLYSLLCCVISWQTNNTKISLSLCNDLWCKLRTTNEWKWNLSFFLCVFTIINTFYLRLTDTTWLGWKVFISRNVDVKVINWQNFNWEINSFIMDGNCGTLNIFYRHYAGATIFFLTQNCRCSCNKTQTQFMSEISS